MVKYVNQLLPCQAYKILSIITGVLETECHLGKPQKPAGADLCRLVW